MATGEQLALFAQKPRRDLRAANEVLAHLRAELGDDAVVRAVLREGHLPEATFSWERVSHVQVAAPRPQPVHHLVRRIYARPVLLPAASGRFHDDGWMLSSMERGPVVSTSRPYVVSGGWWATEVHREYSFAVTRRGDCLWVYYDARRKRWFLHGVVE